MQLGRIPNTLAFAEERERIRSKVCGSYRLGLEWFEWSLRVFKSLACCDDEGSEEMADQDLTKEMW
jgi:hypothetical protein